MLSLSTQTTLCTTSMVKQMKGFFSPFPYFLLVIGKVGFACQVHGIADE